MVPRSAVEHRRTQAAIANLALVEARGLTGARLTRSVAAHQFAAAQAAEDAVIAMLAEQGIEDAASSALNTAAFVGLASDGNPLDRLLRLARSAEQLAMIVLTQVLDTGRIASGVSVASRPTLQGYVRYLNPPSCARCAILAGRFYRWSDGFLRHPRCDCVMLPTDREPGADLVSDPMEAFRNGQIRGLSRADTQAVEDGANLGRVVNVRSTAAGLHTAGGAVLTRGGRVTPEQIYRLAASREQAITLLEAAGYIL